MNVATPAPVRRRVSSIQTHSYVGGPRNEITISEPEALQVLQLINFLQLQAQWPLKSIKPAGRSGFLGSVCGTCMSQVVTPSQNRPPTLPLPGLSEKRSFWPLKQQIGASALKRLLCCQNCIVIFPSNSFLSASGTQWPARVHFSLLTLSRDLSSPPLPSPWHSSLAPAPLLDYTPTPFQMLYQDKVMSVCDREGRTLSAGILKIYSHLQKCLPATEIKPTLFLCKQSRSREGLKTRIFSKLQNIPQEAGLDFTEPTNPHTSVLC